MREPTDLLTQVRTIPRELLPAVLVALAARMAELAAAPVATREAGAPPDRLLSAEETALRLGVDIDTLARRRLPFRVKLGRRTLRYSEAGLNEWMRRERL